MQVENNWRFWTIKTLAAMRFGYLPMHSAISRQPKIELIKNSTVRLKSLTQNNMSNPYCINAEKLLPRLGRFSEPTGSPLMSIIIPVYNHYEYLADCLNSIANQTEASFEIICINDA